MSAADVASTVAEVIRRLTPSVEVIEHPIADGGEGTVELAILASMTPIVAEVTGPLGRPVAATYAMKGETAVIEMAAAAGLAVLPDAPTPATAGAATTFGVGQLILDAIDRGAHRILLGLGGSATTDGGAGLVSAIGGRLTTGIGETLPLGGAQLYRLAEVDLAGVDRRLQEVLFTVACDVDNPLLGPHGAAAIYGPQKGASPALVRRLEQGLEIWADNVERLTGREFREAPGAGAAGGTGFAMLAVAGARLVSGVESLMDLSGLGALVSRADLLIVGEGSLDSQSLRGKGPVGAARWARAAGARVVAVVGRNELTDEQARSAGLDAVYALTDLEPDPRVSMTDAKRLLGQLTAQVVTDWLSESIDQTASGARP